MEHYPVEVRQKQRPVIALIGCTQLHQPVIRSFSLVAVEPMNQPPHVPTSSTSGSGAADKSDESEENSGRNWSSRQPCFHALSWESGGITTARRKEKKSNYDGYVAEGILKSSWMHKHTTSLPAVAVLFLPCEETHAHPSWRQREIALCVEVDKARQSLHNKSIRILVVLVRSSASGPTSVSAPSIEITTPDSPPSSTDTDSSFSRSPDKHNSSSAFLHSSVSSPSVYPITSGTESLRPPSPAGTSVSQVLSTSPPSTASSPSPSPGNFTPGSASFSSYTTHSSALASSPSSSTASLPGSTAAEEPSVPYHVAMASLCRKANITTAQLIEFYKDDIPGSVRALETTITILANLYYLDEIKRIKKTCAQVKKSHPKLSVRQNFKVGYLAEFSSDWTTATSFYSKAFKLLLGLPLDRQNAQEITTVADIINFKLCKIYLLVRHQLPQAVTQFDCLVKQYRQHAGLPQQEFRHWAWLSRQYEVFAQLIERYLTIKQAILKHLHAGFYYHAAAHLSIRRRKAMQSLLSMRQSDSHFQRIQAQVTKPLPAILAGEYFGQFEAVHHAALAHPLADVLLSTTQASSSSQPSSLLSDGTLSTSTSTTSLPSTTSVSSSEEAVEKEGHLRALAAETHADISKIIISLLLRAYNHYISTKRSPRLALRIASEMALEHALLQIDEPQQIAHTTLSRVAQEYRQEKWWALLVSIVRPSLKCAAHLRNTPDYLRHLLELLSLQSYLSVSDRNNYQHLLVDYLHTAGQQQQEQLPLLTAPIEISLDRDPALFNVHVHFLVEEAPLGESADLRIQITSALAQPIRFHRLSVQFSDPSHDFEIEDESGNDPRFLCPHRQPNEPFLVSITPTSKSGTLLECKSLQIQLGKHAPTVVRFAWTSEVQKQRLRRWVPVIHDAVDTQTPPLRTGLRVGYPLPNVTLNVECSEYALVNEHFYFGVTICNLSSSDGRLVSQPVLQGDLVFEIDGDPASTSTVFFHRSNLKKPIQKLEVGALAPEATTNAVVFLQSTQEARQKTVRVQFHYSTSSGQHLAQTTVSFPILNPIITRCSLYSSKFQSVGTDNAAPPVLVGEPCLVRFQIASASSASLEFLEHRLELDPAIASLISTTEPAVLSSVLSPENQTSIWYQIKVHTPGTQQLGRLIVVWNRAASGFECPPTTVAIPIPAVKVALAPFSLKIVSPTEGAVGELMQLRLCITNQTLRVEELQLSVKENDAFIFAGQKRSTLKLIPYASKEVSFFLIPLIAGQLPFPHILLHSKHHLTDLLSEKTQQFVFIRPNPKLTPNLLF